MIRGPHGHNFDRLALALLIVGLVLLFAWWMGR